MCECDCGDWRQVWVLAWRKKDLHFLRDLGLEVSEGQPLTDTVLMQGFLCGVLSALSVVIALGGASCRFG